MPCGIQWPLNHLPSRKKNYIFIYFGMPLKMDDIGVFFIFIFIQITYATTNHFVIIYVTTKCHGGQFYLKSQKWLIWTKVANTWVEMDKIHFNENNFGLTQEDHVKRKFVSFNMQKLEKCDPKP